MPVKIFFCYAREDEAFLNQLQRHLSPLRRQGFIDIWNDLDISAGTEWEQTIKKQLNTAQIILLLVSPDFIDSDYCYSVEMKLSLERHIAGEARVIPIILRPVHWEDAPFSKLQVLPTNGEPVVNWVTSDEAFLKITVGIRKVVIGLLASGKTSEGDALFQEKRYDGALALYDQAIQLDPQYETAYIGKGNALSALNRYQEALSVYEQAIQLDPNLASAYIGKNKIFEQLEKSVQVQQELKSQHLKAQQQIETQLLQAHQEVEVFRKKNKQLEIQLLNAQEQLEALHNRTQQLETLHNRAQQLETLHNRAQQLEIELFNAQQQLARFRDDEHELAALQSRTQQLEIKLLDINQQLEDEQFKGKQSVMQLLDARVEIEALRARNHLLEDQNSKLQVQLETQRRANIGS